MATPTFTASSIVSLCDTGACVIEMVMTSGNRSNPPSVLTQGQLWPRGKS